MKKPAKKVSSASCGTGRILKRYGGGSPTAPTLKPKKKKSRLHGGTLRGVFQKQSQKATVGEKSMSARQLEEREGKTVAEGKGGKQLKSKTTAPKGKKKIRTGISFGNPKKEQQLTRCQ